MNARRGLWVINVIGVLVLTLSLALALDGLGTGEAWAQSTAFDETPPRALSPDRLVYEQLERLPLQPLEDFVSSLDAETRERLPPADLGRLIFEGDGLDLGALARSLLRTFVAEVSLNISLLGQLVLLGVFCALLRNIASTTRTSEAADVAFFVSLLVLLALGLQAFRAAVDVAETTLRTMVDFMQAILPLLATMLAAVGAVTTAAIFHPLLYATVTGIATLIESVLFPVVFAERRLSRGRQPLQRFSRQTLGRTVAHGDPHRFGDVLHCLFRRDPGAGSDRPGRRTALLFARPSFLPARLSPSSVDGLPTPWT